MLYHALAISAVILVLFVPFYALEIHSPAKGRPRTRWRMALAFLAIIGLCLSELLCLISARPAVTFSALIVILAALLCGVRRASTLTFFGVALALTAATYVAFGLGAIGDLYEGYEWQALYPFQSMTARLAYEETKSRPSPHFDEAHLTKIERDTRLAPYWGRPYWLRDLHRTAVERFIDSPGFGRARVVASNRPERLERENRRRDYARIAPGDEERAARTEGDLSALEPLAADAPFLTSLDRGHMDSVLDFANTVDCGYVRDRERVAGFRPHGLHDRPYFAPRRPDSKNPIAGLDVRRLELVSLLKFDEPRVYVLPHSFPRMDCLGDGTTRPLDAFESDALASLQRGEDLVAATAGRQIRLMGSIRAVEQCLACHSVSRGELLGAFTYDLRDPSPPP
jgi:hypothetical protein